MKVNVSSQWYRNAYRRNVVDMHIPDWDKRFLSEFDSRKYVKMLKTAGVDSAVVYAHSHAGLCYFPTKVGQMHRGLKGRNILGELVKECHGNHIKVVIYYSLIYDCWAFDKHPDWRIINADQTCHAEKSRYGVCCPNSSYRDYAVAVIREICEGFDFEGIRFDMTFWPWVCYCRHCLARFSKEVGGKPPLVIDWFNPDWVGFQRKREEWLIDFASLMTSAVKQLKPQATVEHQASTYVFNWISAVTYPLSKENDFLQGDFYGDSLQGSFARKLLYNLSSNLPYGFETSVVCAGLGHHTAIKPLELLQTNAYASVADGGAFIFIDAIDPVGTLNPIVYQRMHSVFKKTKVYDKYRGGAMVQDVALYLSTESKCDFTDNGKTVENDEKFSSKIPHVDGTVSACRALLDSHIPYGVITKRNLGDLEQFKILVLSNVLMVDEEEVAAIREYVRSGGNLYASKYTSLITKEGIKKDNFMMADLFGVSYKGETKENFTYIAPTAEFKNIFGMYRPKYPLGFASTQMIVQPASDTRILGRIVLPYTDPSDPKHFASIHSNPPGINTEYPAVVLNRFGKGKVIYVAGELESNDLHRDIFINLLKLLSNSFTIETNAPKAVEITVFQQEDKRRFIINLINFQKELPNIPVEGINIRFRIEKKLPKTLVVIPSKKSVDYRKKAGYVEFILPRLDTFMMLALEYQRWPCIGEK